MRAVGTLHGKPRHGGGTRRLAEAAERRRPDARINRPGRHLGGGNIALNASQRRSLGGKFLACIGHQRQQETGCDHETQERHDQRQDLRRSSEAVHGVMRGHGGRNEVHAGHRRVVHARDGDAERDRAQHQLHPALTRQEGAKPAIGRGDRDRHRQHDHHGVVLHRKRTRQPVHADIMHAHDPEPEQHGGGHHAQQGRFADTDEKQRDADDQRAKQKGDDGRQDQIDRAGRQRRRQHADEMHGPDTDREKEGRTGQQQTMARIRRAADARRQTKAGVSSQDRDRHRERDEIGIVSFEHDRLGTPVITGAPPPAVEFIGAVAEMTIRRWSPRNALSSLLPLWEKVAQTSFAPDEGLFPRKQPLTRLRRFAPQPPSPTRGEGE